MSKFPHTDEAEPGAGRAELSVRIPWGAVLLLAPGAVLALTTGPDFPCGGAARVVLRILGVRLLLQAGVELRWPRPRVLAVAAAVDGVHAATGVAFGAADRRWRRSALLDAAIAAGCCLATARNAARVQPSRRPPRSTR
ncbi:hypothetical protein [Pseudonocardia sp.]|jgi:hypothetical protein|uniref:hypothetical protein n=1 Tax=Pseudonocardia sp. TaxID=60912 RepID=UPI0031FCCC93